MVPFGLAQNKRTLNITNPHRFIFIPRLLKQSARWAVVTVAPNYFEKFTLYCRQRSTGKTSRRCAAGRLFGHKQIKVWCSSSSCAEHKVNCLSSVSRRRSETLRAVFSGRDHWPLTSRVVLVLAWNLNVACRPRGAPIISRKVCFVLDRDHYQSE